MKSNATSDQRFAGTPTPVIPDEHLREGLFGGGDFNRLYRTTLVVWAFAAAMVDGRCGLPSLFGLTAGTLIALGSLRVTEWIVRLFVQPEAHLEAKWLTALLMLKLPVLTLVMGAAAWASI